MKQTKTLGRRGTLFYIWTRVFTSGLTGDSQAFLSASGMNDLITYIMTSIYTSAAYDEFLTMKYMLGRNILNGRLYPIEIPSVIKANMTDIVSTVKATSNTLEFPERLYNPAHVFQHTDKSNQYLIINADARTLTSIIASNLALMIRY